MDELNARFRRLPFATGLWQTPDAQLADAAVLVHVFDGWENAAHLKWWLLSAGDQSASFIHVGQGFPGGTAPIFNNYGCGLVFRPRATIVKCAKCGDSGGHCNLQRVCPPETIHDPDARLDCGCTWPVGAFGTFLQRQAREQVNHRSLSYNEIIVDGPRTTASAPHYVDAFFCTSGLGSQDAWRQHDLFRREYGEVAAGAVVTLDLNNWEAPFSPCLGNPTC